VVPEFSYARYADQLGLKGIALEDPEKIRDAWDAALAADRPTVIDAKTAPNVPPLPPHISFEQAQAYLSSIVKGDPDAMAMAKQTTKALVGAWR
jgi:pyruvate dehydrogenase (quinone)